MTFMLSKCRENERVKALSWGTFAVVGMLLACSPKESQESKRADFEGTVDRGSDRNQADSCRNPELRLFDDKTAGVLNLKAMALGQIFDVCTATSLMVFIGNADAMGVLEFRSPLDIQIKDAIERNFHEAQQNFARSITKASQGLTHGLETNDCVAAYEEAFERQRAAGQLNLEQMGFKSYEELKQYDLSLIKERGRMLLATIIDGPGSGDSSIKTRWYGWQDDGAGKLVWQGAAESSWGWDRDGQKIVPLEPKEQFELNLPRSLGRIVSQLSQATPNVMPQDVPLSSQLGKFDQVLYVLKTHGGLYTLDPARTPQLLDRTVPEAALPALLFDSHGDRGEVLKSDLYSPFWEKTSACRAYEAANRMDLYDAEQCSEDLSGQRAVVGGTAGVDSGFCSNTAGAGKGLLFAESIAPLSTLKADGILRMGEALTYGTTASPLRGIGNFVIVPGLSPYVPGQILLDSCYGSERVADALQNSLKGWPHSLVTISNSNPLYFDLIQYDRLNASGHLMLPYILVDAEFAKSFLAKGAPPTVSEDQIDFSRNLAKESLARAEELVKHFTVEGLTPLAGEETTPEPAYRILTPRVLFLNSTFKNTY